MSVPAAAISALQKRTWTGSLPLEIRLATSDCRTYDQSDPYLVHIPRLSYLPFLLPRLHAFFASSLIDPTIPSHEAWLEFQELPLKWHYPLGLLYDLFSGSKPADADQRGKRQREGTEHDAAREDQRESKTDAYPWKLTLHYTDFPMEQLFQIDNEGKVLQDAYINSVKEADFLRNGSARTVMSLSKDDSSALWRSVETHDLALFNSVNNKLLNPPGQALKHIPIKVYLPTRHRDDGETGGDGRQEGQDQALPTQNPQPGSVRVIQTLVTPYTSSRQPTTLGVALNQMLPTVFPSRRNPVLAAPVLHGAVVPMAAPVEDLCRAAGFADGFLHVVVVLLA